MANTIQKAPATRGGVRQVEIPLEFWQYPKAKRTSIVVTEDQVKKELQNIDPDKAATITNAIFAGAGGATGIVATILGAAAGLNAAGPIGSLVFGIIAIAAGVGAGILAIVQRVRTENGTNISAFNSVPGSRLEVKGTSDFNGKLINDNDGTTLDVSVADQAYAVCNKDQIGGFGLHLTPHGGKSKTAGTFFLDYTIAGKRFTFLLNVTNKVGAGQTSTYSMTLLPTPTVFSTIQKFPTPLIVSSNRKADDVTGQMAIGKLFMIRMELKHGVNDKGNKDQRKDMVKVFFTPTPEYLDKL